MPFGITSKLSPGNELWIGVDDGLRDRDPLVKLGEDSLDQRPEAAQELVTLGHHAVDRPDRDRGDRAHNGDHRQGHAPRAMNVDDVEPPLRIQAIELPDEERTKREPRLRAVHVERAPARDPDELEQAFAGRLTAIHRFRGDNHLRRDQRHLVAAADELIPQPMDMLGNTTELRVVVLADDRDPHKNARLLGHTGALR
jgi:hypothetical protein